MMDLNYTRDTTSGQEGLEVIPRIQALDNTLPIVVMTAWATIDLAVEAMKLGARDFVPKPWDNERLLAIVRTQIELVSRVAQRPTARSGESIAARRRAESDCRIAAHATGDGDDLARRAVGREHSDHRRKRNRQRIGRAGAACAFAAQFAQHDHSEHGRTCRKTLFESELFGHVKGAFTDAKTDRAGRFELADESTLFMDEIANIPLNQQAKLLRVIETGEFERVGSSKTLHANVRIISATNANLHEEVAAGRFRQDLLFRLNTIEIALPPLRERREDIMPLANKFLRQHAQRYRKKLAGFDEPARDLLMQHQYPGNVRELDHVIERAVLMAQGHAGQGERSWPNEWPRRFRAPRGHEPGGSGSIPDQESSGASRWKCAQGSGSARTEPERILSAPAAIWTCRRDCSPRVCANERFPMNA